MHRPQSLDRLQFDNQPILYQKIDLERIVDDNAIMPQRHGDLASNLDSSSLQHHRNQRFVSAFEKPRSKLAMQSKTAIDYDTSKLLQIGIAGHLRVFV